MNIEHIVKQKIRRCYVIYAVVSLILLCLPWLYAYSSAQDRAKASEFVQLSSQQSLLIRDITLNLYRFEQPLTLKEKRILRRQSIVLMKQFSDNHNYFLVADLPRNVFQGGNHSVHDLYFSSSASIDSLSKEFFDYVEQIITSGLVENRNDQAIEANKYNPLVDHLDQAEAQFTENEEQARRHMVNVSILASIISLIVFAIMIVALIYPIEQMLFKLIKRFSLNAKRAYRVKRDAGLDQQTKNQFLSNMSHKLRSPISGMFGMLELASQETDIDSQKAYIQKAQKAGNQLLSLVDELLDISRIEAKVLTFDKIDFELLTVLDSVIAPTASSAETKGLTFSYNAATALPQFAIGDPLRLTQTLKGLLDNAVKFTENGGISVNVKLSIVNKHYMLDVFINDTGVGIEQDKQDQIFNKFFQVDKTKNIAMSGAGLGLTIAKEFAQGMGGDLSLSSTLGRGSTFTLSVPLERSEKCVGSNTPLNHNPKAKFAVIDDLETSRLHISHVLQEDGFTVDLFDSATQFLLMKDEILDYAGLIIDIHMPGYNGYELAETIHAMFGNSAPPFIFISASPEAIRHDRFNTEHMWQGFAKPMDKNRFIDSIRVLSDKNALKTAAFEPANVLLVEDEPINAEVVKTMLERNGHIVEVATTGAAALHLATTVHFNLILMDINLPDMSGLETTRCIKAQGVDTEIVALTGNAYEEDKLKTKEAGMSYHLVKPVMYHELNNVIKLALRVVH